MRARRGDISIYVGSRVIHLPGREDKFYVAPNLVFHYVTRHFYRPPNEFLDAVLSFDFDEANRLDAKNLKAWGDAAWLLATCPNPEGRNGKKALEYAMKAYRLAIATRDKRCAALLDVLGAAYAEDGRFEQAVGCVELALKDSAYATSELGRKAQERLKLYEQGKPYREK
jgi:hypothetical protein